MGRALLLLVSGLVVVVGIVLKSMKERQAALLPDRSGNYVSELHARNLANGMIDAALGQLKRDPAWNAGDTRFPLPDEVNGSGWVTIFDRNSPPDSLPPDHSAGSQEGWDENVLLFWSQASIHGYTAQTEVKMNREAFSRYSYFTDLEPPDIYFTSSDELTGPVHTNGTLQVAGEPVFYGKVTSPTGWQGHPSYTNNPRFEGMTDFSAPVLAMPGDTQMDALRNAATAAGLRYGNPIRVVLEESGGTGTVKVYVSDDCCWSSETLYALSEVQYEGQVVSSSREVAVKGRLKGALTIHSATAIEIIGDIEYARDPVANPGSGDILGLVSEGDVILDDNAHTDHGSQDITLQGTIMALNNSFYVENYGSGTPRGTINLLGGIVQRERGAVGTFDSGGVTSGFGKNYTFDERLRDMVPPHYPRLPVFSPMYWKESIVERPASN